MMTENAKEMLGKESLPQQIQSRCQNRLQQLWEIVEHTNQQAKNEDSNVHHSSSL